MMKKPNLVNKTGIVLALFFAASVLAWAQQQDVPEPVFVNFSIQPPYVPTYHGRDPFRVLTSLDRSPQISISELDYRGVIYLGTTPIAMFTWRTNPSIQYTLRARKLYGGAGKEVDGVVGDISDESVVLFQGEQKVVYSRK